MTTDIAAGEAEEHRQQHDVIAWLTEMFNLPGVQWGRGVMFLDVVLVPLVLLLAIRRPRHARRRSAREARVARDQSTTTGSLTPGIGSGR